MKCAEKPGSRAYTLKPESILQMPQGLLGFEQYREYSVQANPDEAPFQWLQVVGEPSLAFLVVSPFLFMPEYQPNVGSEDVRSLGLKVPEDAIVVNIVTMRGPGHITVNLKGPIIVNRHTLVAKQVVPVNALHFNLQYPLPVAG
jgi:flagellar assembly factor FliW